MVVRYTDKVHRHVKGGRHGIRVYFVNSILNCIFWLKIDFYSNFQFNLLSNSLIRFWILKHKSIIEIQFLKWKLKTQFSILNFWGRKYFTSNPAFSKNLVIELTSSITKWILFLYCFHCSGVEIDQQFVDHDKLDGVLSLM